MFLCKNMLLMHEQETNTIATSKGTLNENNSFFSPNQNWEIEPNRMLIKDRNFILN